MTGTINLYNVYVGDFSSEDSQQTIALMDYIAANIGGSSWNNMMTTYYQINSDGSRTYMSNAAQFIMSVNILPTAQGIAFSEIEVIMALIGLFNDQTLPIDTDGVYCIILRGDISYDGWLSVWCGYHTAFYLNDGRIIKFAFVGDPSTAPDGAACEAISDGKV